MSFTEALLKDFVLDASGLDWNDVNPPSDPDGGYSIGLANGEHIELAYDGGYVLHTPDGDSLHNENLLELLGEYRREHYDR